MSGEQERVIEAAAEAAEVIRQRILDTPGDDLHAWLTTRDAVRAFAHAFVMAHARRVPR